MNIQHVEPDGDYGRYRARAGPVCNRRYKNFPCVGNPTIFAAGEYHCYLMVAEKPPEKPVINLLVPGYTCYLLGIDSRLMALLSVFYGVG